MPRKPELHPAVAAYLSERARVGGVARAKALPAARRREIAAVAGRASAAKLTPEERRAFAQRASLIRYHGRCAHCGEPALAEHRCPGQLTLFPADAEVGP